METFDAHGNTFTTTHSLVGQLQLHLTQLLLQLHLTQLLLQLATLPTSNTSLLATQPSHPKISHLAQTIGNRVLLSTSSFRHDGNRGLGYAGTTISKTGTRTPRARHSSRNTRSGIGIFMATHSSTQSTSSCINRAIQVVGPRKRVQWQDHRRRMACNIDATCHRGIPKHRWICLHPTREIHALWPQWLLTMERGCSFTSMCRGLPAMPGVTDLTGTYHSASSSSDAPTCGG